MVDNRVIITLDISENALRKIRQWHTVRCMLDDDGSEGLNIGVILADKILQAAGNDDKMATIKTKEDK